MHIHDAVLNVIDPLFYAWNLSHNANTLFQGFESIVNTNIFYPLTNTIAYSDTLWAQSIMANPIIWITHNPILAENILIFLSFPLSAISMFFLSYYFSRNLAASLATGIFYAFSYPRLSQIGHLPMISSQWLPLYLLYLFKFLDESKLINLFWLCFWYIMATASSIYFGVFLVPITLLILAIHVIKRSFNHSLNLYKKTVMPIVLLALPFLIVLTLVVSPYIRLKVENPDIKRSIDDVTFLRANLLDYVSVLPTSHTLNRVLPNNTNEHVLFPTITLLLLASIGALIAFKKSKYHITILLFIILTSFILSLGNEQSFTLGSYSTGVFKLPYYYAYQVFPLLQIVRVPARFSIFTILSMSALSGYGLHAFLKNNKHLGIAAVCVCLYLLEVWQTNVPFVKIPLENSMPKAYSWVKNQPEPIKLAELPVSLFYHGNIMEDQLYRSYYSLTQSDTYALETYRVYFSSFHRKRLINGYSGYLPATYNSLTEALEGFPSDTSIKALQDIGVTHAVVHLFQYNKETRPKITSLLSKSTLLTLDYSDEYDQIYSIQKK